MIITEIKNILRDNLSKFLITEGFKYSSGLGGAGFKKNTNYGFVELVYGVINYEPIFKISTLGYLMRYTFVEELCEKFNQNFDGNSNPKNVCTIGGGYGGIINDKYYDFAEMSTPQEVNIVAHVIKEAYFNELKPFLEKHSDINYLENEINKNTERDLPYILYWRGRRSMRGLILAKLCNNPRYEELKIIYRQKCIEQEDADVLEAYDKLAYYLDHEFEKT